jgi:EmrB/QacA subfamily drug resistance transporter
MEPRHPSSEPSARRWALALTSIAFFMGSLDTLVVITALPAVQRGLGGSLSTLQWTVNAYALASAAGIITAAALGDRLGRRRVFGIGLALFTAASAACALAPTAEALIAARAVQGLAASMVMPLSLTILTAAFPAQRRGAVVGIWGGIAGLAVAGGPLVGGAVTQGIDWHWIFWVNVPIGLVAAVLSALRLAESHGPATRLDLPAAALVSGGATALVWGLVRAGEAGWDNAATLIPLALGLALLAGFAAWERRAPAPMLPLRLFASRPFVAAGATTFLMTAALMGTAVLLTEYLQVGRGLSPLTAGLWLLPMTTTPLLVAPAAGALADRIGPRPVMVTGMALMAAGAGWLALAAGAGVGFGQLAIPLLIAGAGVSMPFATTATAVLNAVAPADLGKASGANGTIQRFGAAFGIAVVTAVVAAHAHGGTAAGLAAGLRPALTATVALALAGAVTALAVGGKRRARTAPTPEPVAAAAAGN